MSMYIDSAGRLQNERAANLALTCPHCAVYSHITPLAVPGFAALSASRPKQIGLVYRCDACNAPIFLRANVRSYGSEQIELSSQFEELERAPEHFNFAHLPPEVETLFRETLQCYSHGLLNAFASMCRRSMQAVFAHLGEAGKLRVFDELNHVRDMAEIELDVFTPIKRVLFGTDADPTPSLPLIDEDQAGLLLEVMKDLLYECYVRKARLRQALIARHVFADSSERHGAQALASDLGA